MQINSINFKILKLAALYGFFMLFLELIEKTGAEKLKIKALVDGLLKPAFQKLDDAYKKSRGSEFTEEIQKTDKLLDNATSSILGIINVMLKSSDAETVGAAKKLKSVFNKFKGIIKKPRIEQVADTVNLLQELKGKYAPDITKLGLDEFVSEVEALNKKLASFGISQAEETADKVKNDAAAAKSTIIDAYRTTCNQIMVNVKLEGAANYEEFIRNLNAIIGKFGSQSGNTVNGGSADDRQAPSDDDEKYPNAREWSEDIDYQTCASGDIFYIVRNGVKEYYKLLDFGEVATFEPGMDDGGIWEKIS